MSKFDMQREDWKINHMNSSNAGGIGPGETTRGAGRYLYFTFIKRLDCICFIFKFILLV